MKWNWNSLFGGSSVELSDDPMWRTPTTMSPIASGMGRFEARMVADGKVAKVEMVLTGEFAVMTMTLSDVAAVDAVINQLIKMRDLLEKVEQPSTLSDAKRG